MMVLLFLLIALAIIFMWFKLKRTSIMFFSAYFILAIIWFSHHATDKLNITL